MNRNLDGHAAQHTHYVHAVNTAVPQPRETDGRFGTKQHAELEAFQMPATDTPAVADQGSRDDARLTDDTSQVRDAAASMRPESKTVFTIAN